MNFWQSHRWHKWRWLHCGAPCETAVQAGGSAPGTQSESMTPGLSSHYKKMPVAKCNKKQSDQKAGVEREQPGIYIC